MKKKYYLLLFINSIFNLNSILSQPIITSFSPTATHANSFVYIYGQYFTDINSVSFGNIPATYFQVISDNVVYAVVGTGGSGNIVVASPSGSGSLPGFTFLTLPDNDYGVSFFAYDSVGVNARNLYSIELNCTNIHENDTLQVKFVKSTSQTYMESSIEVNSIIGDTLIWLIPIMQDHYIYQNSFTIGFKTKNTVIPYSSYLNSKCFISGNNVDTFQVNNQFQLTQQVKGQRQFLNENMIATLWGSDFPAFVGTPREFSFYYNISSDKLDSLSGKIKILKDTRLSYSDFLPLPQSNSGDTLIWYIDNLFNLDSAFNIRNYNTYPDFYTLKLIANIPTSLAANIGDSLKFVSVYQINVIDTIPTVDYIDTFYAPITGQNAAVYNFHIVSDNADNEVYSDCYCDSVIIADTVNYNLIYIFDSPVLDSISGKIYFELNPSLIYLDANPSPTTISGDSLSWNFNYSNIGGFDTIHLRYKINPTATVGDTMTLYSSIRPSLLDTFELYGLFTTHQVIKGQNSLIENPYIHIASKPNAKKGEIMKYEIINTYQSSLDTTFGVIKLVKDHNTSLSSATPAPTSIVADTLFWNFSSLNSNLTDTIILNLLINESSNVQIGDTIKNIASIRFFTFDTFVLQRFDTLNQVISVICTPPNLTNTTLSAPQGIQWLRTLGGSEYDASISSAIFNDTSFVVAGISYSSNGDFSPGIFDSTNAFVVKYNTNGNYLWKKIIGGNAVDAIEYIHKNADGSFIATGTSASDNGVFITNHGEEDAWILKLDSNGNILWQKLIGGSNNDYGLIIKPTIDGGYIFLGITESVDFDVLTNPYPNSIYGRSWAIKLNATGNIVWQQFFADSVFSEANDVIQTLDGGYIIGGAAPDGSFYSIPTIASIVKMDNSGNIVYCKKLNIPEHFNTYTSVVQNTDSSFVLTGNIYKSIYTDTTCIGLHGGSDLLVSKLDKSGNISFSKYFGGTDHDWGVKIIKSNDGGYIVNGSTNSLDGNVSGYHETLPSLGYSEDDGWILKLDSATNIVWQKTIGGNEFDKILSVLQFPNNDIFVTGSTSSKNNGDIFNYHGGDADVFVAKMGTANFIRGYVFVDQNNDGIKQAAEAYFNNGNVNSKKGPFISASNLSNGFYANSVDTGTYITKVIFNSSYYSPSPIADTTVFNNYLQTDIINFAMSPLPGIKDLNITLIPLNPARPGFATQYQIKYENIGTTAFSSGTVNFLRGNKTVFDSASVAPSNISADTLSWNFSNFSPLESKTITVYLHLLPPPQNNNGDTLILSATISPVIGDTTPLNNESTVNQLITGSFDPNLKTETHGGILTNEQILDGEYLNYVIYFQNTGTDTAFRVVIRDTLNNSLDWKSFEMINTSHLSTLSISDSNKLEWKFDPIILPDSNHNEIESHGFVAFKIKPKSNMSAGNLITNKASIYFDFNLPIETNNNSTFISTESFICPGSNTYFPSNYPGNHTYQWQVNNGDGFYNINNNAIFNGAMSDTLKLIAPPTSFYGNKYRCLIDSNVESAEYSLKFATRWKGTANNAWENPLNWSCGSIPDYNTDVFINSALSNYPEINANSGCRSIKCKAGSYVLIKSGVSFILNGK